MRPGRLLNRPHVKTHKCVEIATRQVALGAIGVTCQTLFEAETMVAAGIDDVLIPVNILGTSKLARLAALHERARITVSVDDARLLPGLTGAAGDQPLGVLVDCDTGLGRTGVGSPAAAAARGRRRRHGSLRSQVSSPIRHHRRLRRSSPRRWRSPRPRVSRRQSSRSVARRACGAAASSVPTATEYRAGTYAFHDRATVAAGAATIDEVAMTVLATVISCPAPGRVILDAGSKALTSDPGPDASFGEILEAPGATVTKLNEEHGYVTLGGATSSSSGSRSMLFRTTRASCRTCSSGSPSFEPAPSSPSGR